MAHASCRKRARWGLPMAMRSSQPVSSQVQSSDRNVNPARAQANASVLLPAPEARRSVSPLPRAPHSRVQGDHVALREQHVGHGFQVEPAQAARSSAVRCERWKARRQGAAVARGGVARVRDERQQLPQLAKCRLPAISPPGSTSHAESPSARYRTRAGMEPTIPPPPPARARELVAIRSGNPAG